MADQHSDLLRAFEGLVADHQPSPVQVDAARIRLRQEIAAEREPQRIPTTPWRARVVAAVAVVIAFVVATSVLPWGRSTADAYLLEIAEATRVLPATELPEGAYLYTESNGIVSAGSTVPEGYELEEIFYLTPLRIQSWIQGDFQLMRETVGEPIFFDEAMERVFYESGLAAFERSGEPVETAHEGYAPPEDPAQWSTDVDALRGQLEAVAELAQNGLPLEQRIVNVAFGLLLPETQASPAQRAAVIEVVASLDVETEKLADGNVSLSISYEDEYYGAVIESWTIDGSGYLVGATLVTLNGPIDGSLPAGTAFSDIVWSTPQVAEEAGLVPGN